MTPELGVTANAMIPLLELEISARGGEDADLEAAYLTGCRDTLALLLGA